ncbi:MAG: serine hydrolase [Bacteroidales bacterium]|jgi:CubicO group peptidase (beta-lactamase class C family)|nr:serine hydrolase [Bacteroidales bacterium]
MKNLNFRFGDTVKILAMLMYMLVSCEKDASDDIPVNPDDSEKPALTVTPAARNITFSADALRVTSGGMEFTPTFTVTTNQPTWKVSSNKAWVHIDTVANTFTLTADPHTSLVPPEAATVTVTAGMAPAVAIRVTQLSASADSELKRLFFTNVNAGISAEVNSTFGGTHKTVSKRLIFVTVPEACDLTRLKMSFLIHTKAKMYINGTPATLPSQETDFSGVVELKVEAETGKTSEYLLLVKKGNSAMDQLVYNFMTTYSLPGVSLSIMRGVEVIYSCGFGLADVENEIRVTPDHLFRLASVSKQFTSAGILALVDAGLLDLDQNVFGAGGILADEFPGVTGDKATVTPRHFLYHTSGWSNSPSDPMFSSPYQSQSLNEQINHMLSTLAFNNAPGSSYAYFNLGYGVLGKIIEKVSGKSYETYMKEFLASAGITDMHTGGNRAGKRDNECVYYSQDGTNGYGNNMQAIAAAGGLISSTAQMMKFLAAIDGDAAVPDLISSASRTAMLTPSSANSGYGLGWRMNHTFLYPGGYYHDGNLAGTAAMWCGGVEGGYNAALLFNSRSYLAVSGMSFDTAMYLLLGEILNKGYGVRNTRSASSVKSWADEKIAPEEETLN